MNFPNVKATVCLAAIVFSIAITLPLAGQVTGRFYLSSESYAEGEPLMFTLEIKNGTPDVIYLFPKHQGQCSDPFSFSMQGTNPQSSGMVCGTTWDTKCNDDTYELKAGDTYTVQWPLDFWYRIEHDGSYKVSISRKTWFTSLKGGIQPLQVSSELQLNVVPGDPAQVEETLRKFQAELQNPDAEVQHQALDVLATTAPSYFHDEALRLARDEDVFYVIHAEGALERMNTPETRAALAEIITTRKADSADEQNARCGAIKGLGNSGDTSYLPMLAPYAEHTSTCESEFAIYAIAELGKGSSVSQLQSYLHSQQPKQHLYAAEALRYTMSPDAVDALIGALRDKDASVREKAASNLIELTGHSVTKPNQATPGPIQLENLWRSWWHNHHQDATLIDPPPEICRMP
jgi:hypothetical protein